MSKFNRYVFRVYNIGQPNYKTKHFFQNRYKGDDALYLQNPYLGSEYNQYNLDSYHKLGNVINYHDKKSPTLKQDFFNRRNRFGGLNIPSKAVYDGKGNKIYLPHKGISVIGLADPKYSLYNFNDIGSFYRLYRNNKEATDYGRFMGFNDISKVEYDTALEDYLDKQNLWRDIHARALDSGFQDVINEGIKRTGWKPGSNRYITFDDKHFSKDELKKVLDTFRGLSNTKDNYLKNMPVQYPEVLEYTKTPYTNMLRALLKTLEYTSANGFVLATVPEDALYTVDDIRKGNLRGQRDFPEELVVRRFKPIKAFSALKHTEPDMSDYFDSDGEFDEDSYDEDKSNWLNNLIFNPSNSSDIVQDYDKDNKLGALISHVGRANFELSPDRWSPTSPEEIEKRSKNFISDSFEVDPDDFISDETKKYIYKDLSDWYNKSKEAQKKINDRQKNISDTLESWRY